MANKKHAVEAELSAALVDYRHRMELLEHELQNRKGKFLKDPPAPTPPLHKFGVEYTFVPKAGVTSEGNSFDYLLKCKEELVQHTEFKSAYIDGAEVLEVPSPPHTSMEEHAEFYEKLAKLAARMQLTARRVDREKDGSLTYHGTGGGHIHLELPPKWTPQQRAALMTNLIVRVAHRPWLSWVFNEFMDDWNAKSLLHSPQVRQMMNNRLRMPIRTDGYTNLETFMSGMLGKGYALRFADLEGVGSMATAEFRFFDAPRSWKQSREHIAFAQALFDKCVKCVQEHGHLKDIQAKGLDYLKLFQTREAVEADFKKTVLWLGLKWKDYRKYMVNYDDRKSFGELN